MNAPGKPGDFDFLAGHWNIANKRANASQDGWDVFSGEATCWSILNGGGSIEELRIPERNFFGLGIRLLERNTGVWSDHWVSGQDGILSTPGMTGAFVDGDGIFVADDVDDAGPVRVRGVWDRITPNACRWRQAASRDGGTTWEENWLMDWTRA
jgi:hypothetical protein